jgi:hypothetical protein
VDIAPQRNLTMTHATQINASNAEESAGATRELIAQSDVLREVPAEILQRLDRQDGKQFGSKGTRHPPEPS